MCKKTEKLYRSLAFPRQEVHRCVSRACERLGIAEIPVLHKLRHTGPANAILKGTKSLEQVRRRGRWASLKSVERYSKTAHVLADLGSLSPEVRLLGETFLANPSECAFARDKPAVRFLDPRPSLRRSPQ